MGAHGLRASPTFFGREPSLPGLVICQADLDESGVIDSLEELEILMKDVFKGTISKSDLAHIMSLFEGPRELTWPVIRSELSRINRDQRMSIWEVVFHILNDPTCCRLSLAIAIFIMCVIFVSCTTFLLETMNQFQYHPGGDKNEEPQPLRVFATIEIFCIAVFSREPGTLGWS